MSKAVFLDRDGVINLAPPQGKYITSVSQLHILPQAPGALKLLKELGFRLIVVTNQRCIGKGLISADEMDNICLFMNRRLESCGAGIDRFYYCPHDYSNCCDCRKPKPGLIQTAARDMCLDVKSSYMIGDSEVDVGAGLAAECKLVCYISRKKYQNNRVLNCRDIWDAAVRIKENTQEVPLCLRRER